MNSREFAERSKYLRAENAKWPATLAVVEDTLIDDPMGSSSVRVRTLRSKGFLVQVFLEPLAVVRLSINRTAIDRNGNWIDGITWEEIQKLKREAGYAELEAVEVFPPDSEIVNVANIRHIWILPKPMPFSWRKIA